MQTVKHEFAGLLDNFRSFDRILQAPQLRSRQKGANQRVDDARSRVRALYAAKRYRLHNKQRHHSTFSPLSSPHHPHPHHPHHPHPHHLPRHASNTVYDTSAWSQGSPIQPWNPDTVDINDISVISGKKVLREQTSGLNLSGVLHSTLDYPLHSTLNYPLHSTVLEESNTSLGSPLLQQHHYTGKRRLFQDHIEEREEEEDEEDCDVEIDVDQILPVSSSPVYLQRCLKRQTAQARLDDDIDFYRHQMLDTDISCDLSRDITMISGQNASNDATCHSMPDLTLTSQGCPSKTNNKSSSTNTSSLPLREVPRNSPNTDQSAASSRKSRRISEKSSRHSFKSKRTSAHMTPLDLHEVQTPYRLQKSTSVRLHDRAMRKSLKRKMRRFNEDIQRNNEHRNAYDVLVYL